MLLVTLVAGAAVAQAAPAHVLFIGNSLTYSRGGVDTMLNNLCDAEGVTMDAQRETVGGMRLSQHATRPETLARVRQGGWDVIVLQGHSNDATEQYDSFVAGANTLDAEIKAVGAKTMLYMTWSYQDQLAGTMTQDVADAYLGLGTSLGAEVVPCGLAWKWMCDNTGLRMYDDNIHPNTYGVYLVGCMFYAALFDQSPEGNTYGSAYGVSGAIANNIQGLAWDYVSGDTIGVAVRARQCPVQTVPTGSPALFDLMGRVFGVSALPAMAARPLRLVSISADGRILR
jgi:hypothetical protein